MSFTPNDGAHFFFALPVFAYATILIFEHYRIFRVLHRHSEAIFIIALSIPIFFSNLVAFYNCPEEESHHCRNINYMHIFAGIFMFEAGVLGIVQERGGVWSTVPKLMSPLVLFFLGFFMTVHAQSSEYAVFIHQAFGASAIVTAILRYVSYDNPAKYLVLACVSAMITALLFVMGSDSVEAYWMHKMNHHNVMFLVITIVLAYFLIIMTFINWKLRGRPTLPHYTAVPSEEKLPYSSPEITHGPSTSIPLIPMDNNSSNLTERGR